MTKPAQAILIFILVCFVSTPAGSGTSRLTAVFPTWKPYGYVEDQKATGFEIEVFQAVMDRMNLQVEFIHQPWKRCLYSVKNGYADVVISSLKVEERQAYLNYPDHPISQSHTALFTTADQTLVFNGIFENLAPHTIGVTSGFSYGPGFDAADFLIKDPSTETRAVVEKVLLRRNDLGVGNIAVIRSIAKEKNALAKIKFLKPLLHSQNLYAAFSKARGHEQLVIEFSNALAEFQNTAEHARIMEKYAMIRAQQ